jgi:hypothetical protein
VEKIKDTVQKTGSTAQYSLKNMEKSSYNQLNREQGTPQCFYWKKISNIGKDSIL